MDIAHDLEITYGRRQIHDSLKKAKVSKVVMPEKPRLNADNRQKRLDFAYWALERLENGDVFVFSDETYIEIGERRGKVKVSHIRGQDINELAEPEQKPGHTFMFWAAMAVGEKGPTHIWEVETVTEKKMHAEALDKENEAEKQQILQKRARAKVSGTREHKVLSEINANIHALDAIDPLPSGRKRMLRRPEWEWGFKPKTRTSEGGIDWFLYWKEILLPKLYPFVAEIQYKHSGKNVWLVEDNAPSHTKAAKDPEVSQMRQDLQIHLVDWPPNSPDLNKVEPLWNYLKDSLATWGIKGASKEACDRARQAVLTEWDRMEQSYVDRQAKDFKDKLELCIKHESHWLIRSDFAHVGMIQDSLDVLLDAGLTLVDWSSTSWGSMYDWRAGVPQSSLSLQGRWMTEKNQSIQKRGQTRASWWLFVNGTLESGPLAVKGLN